MLDYLRKRLAQPDSLSLIVTTLNEMYEGAAILAVDQTGIALECRSVVICLPWTAIVEIETED